MTSSGPSTRMTTPAGPDARARTLSTPITRAGGEDVPTRAGIARRRPCGRTATPAGPSPRLRPGATPNRRRRMTLPAGAVAEDPRDNNRRPRRTAARTAGQQGLCSPGCPGPAPRADFVPRHGPALQPGATGVMERVWPEVDRVPEVSRVQPAQGQVWDAASVELATWIISEANQQATEIRHEARDDAATARADAKQEAAKLVQQAADQARRRSRRPNSRPPRYGPRS